MNDEQSSGHEQVLRDALAELGAKRVVIDFVLRNIFPVPLLGTEVKFRRETVDGNELLFVPRRKQVCAPGSVCTQHVECFMSRGGGHVLHLCPPEFPPSECGEGNGSMCGENEILGISWAPFKEFSPAVWAIECEMETSGGYNDDGELEEKSKLNIILYTK